MPSTPMILPISDVFDEKTLQAANNSIGKMPWAINARENIWWVDCKEDGWPHAFSYQDVSFNKEGRITQWQSFSDTHLLRAGESIINMTKEGIEKMACTLGWKDQTIKMSTNILIYQLTSEHPYVADMPWHADDGKGYHISMTVVLSPYDQGELGFRGGELGYRPYHEQVNCSQCAKEVLGFSKEVVKCADDEHHQSLPLKDKEGIKCPYPYNGGFIFSNREAQHRVHDITVDNPQQKTDFKVKRGLFTIFTRLTAEQYHKTIEDNGAHSLFKYSPCPFIHEGLNKLVKKINSILDDTSNNYRQAAILHLKEQANRRYHQESDMPPEQQEYELLLREHNNFIMLDNIAKKIIAIRARYTTTDSNGLAAAAIQNIETATSNAYYRYTHDDRVDRIIHSYLSEIQHISKQTFTNYHAPLTRRIQGFFSTPSPCPLLRFLKAIDKTIDTQLAKLRDSDSMGDGLQLAQASSSTGAYRLVN